jgi:hypothetical protein
MKKSLRLALLACAGVLGLAFAGPALATFTPSLTVEQTSYKPGAAVTADMFVVVPKDDDATAKITILSPAGYSANLNAAAGTKIGQVVAIVKAKALAGATLALAGNVVVGNKTDPTIMATSAQCRSSKSPTNDAVWILNASLQGQTLSIPVFVNRAGPLVTMEVCFASPDMPSPAGAPFGAQLLVADFSVKGVFTNSSTGGGHEWSGIFTPWTPGPTGTPNAAGTVEWRTYLGLPQTLTFRRVKSKPSLVTFAGALSIPAVGTTNVRLHLYYGKKPGPAPTAVSGGDPKAKFVRTRALRRGRYTISRPRVRAKTFFQMRFEDYGLKCTGASPSGLPVPCLGEDLAPMTSSQIKVLPPKKKRHR